MKFTTFRRVRTVAAALLFAMAAPAVAEWPMFGGSASRNFANTAEKNILSQWCIAKGKEQNVKWKATLGGNAFGGPVVAGGRIFIGTNNYKPYDKNIMGDKGVLLCLNEADGKFLWQIVHDKLGNSDQDVQHMGVVSTPAVDGNRLYYVSNRCELVCAETAGDPDRPGKGKIVWSLDMMKTLKVSPGGLEGCVSSGSPLVLDDMVYVITSNGVDMKTGKPAAPRAPSFVAVHKSSGELAWSSNLPGDGILDIQFSSPAAAEINGVKQVVFGGGDGWLYSFEAKKGALLWKFDCNPKDSVFKPMQGVGTRNYLLASPVIVDGKVYIGVGREPEAGLGPGHFWCIDAAKKPVNQDKDLSPVNDNFDPKAVENKDSGLVWHFGGPIVPKPPGGEREYYFGRTMSMCCVNDGLVYVTEVDGFLHCLDAKTGRRYWVHDLEAGVWASPFYVDGKVYMGTDYGDMLVFAAGKEDKLLNTIDCKQVLRVAPVAANSVLYVNTGVMLYAIAPP